jgi:hypothetical protein
MSGIVDPGVADVAGYASQGASVAPAAATKAASTGIMGAIPKSAMAYGALGLAGAALAEEPEQPVLTDLQKAQIEKREVAPYYEGRDIVRRYDYSQDPRVNPVVYAAQGGLIGAVDQLKDLRQDFNTGIDSVIGGGGNLQPQPIGFQPQPQPIGFLGDLQRPSEGHGRLPFGLNQPDSQLLAQTLRGGPQMLAEGGYIQGPGTGKSDSIKSGIYQNGQKVQEARLSDGEFVMTEEAVRGAGNGNRAQGAARMYNMMRQYERMA